MKNWESLYKQVSEQRMRFAIKNNKLVDENEDLRLQLKEAKKVINHLAVGIQDTLIEIYNKHELSSNSEVISKLHLVSFEARPYIKTELGRIIKDDLV